jgi:hypothetical protein
MTTDINDLKKMAHPLDDVFGIEKNTTISNIQGREVELFSDEEVDRNKDAQIDGQFDEVYNIALEAFNTQNELTQTIDPRYSARNAEVGAQYLKIALDAAGAKATKLINNKKLRGGKGGDIENNGTINTNIIVSDRNSLLKFLADANKIKETEK